MTELEVYMSYFLGPSYIMHILPHIFLADNDAEKASSNEVNVSVFCQLKVKQNWVEIFM